MLENLPMADASRANGPAHQEAAKLGGRVVYAVEDLQAWADLGVRLSTSEKARTHIRPVSGR